ncbi:MAG: hypothetical protein H8Z69_00935 [Nanohaloarchaea archaeon]|nr:hypothetical protein [Candidatus Nanohaloarchaea archaeon]
MFLEKAREKIVRIGKRYVNRSFGLGLAFGVILSSMILVAGPTVLEESKISVPVTVVTCDNCSYGKFQNATDRMFNADYNEVNYESEKGQELTQKYELNYVPAFIFDRKVENAEAFNRVKPTLVEFEDAYVIPDAGVKVAQRLSEGISLK